MLPIPSSFGGRGCKGAVRIIPLLWRLAERKNTSESMKEREWYGYRSTESRGDLFHFVGGPQMGRLVDWGAYGGE